MVAPGPGGPVGPGRCEAGPMQTPPPDAGLRVLVVDDDLTVAEVVAGYLGRAGYEVTRADDGAAALECAARHRPDLVVLDLMLPGMDGLEVCRRLRAEGPVPVIMLTARGDEDDRILGLEVGADDYVTKPFSPRELVLRVESVLRRSRTGPAAVSGAPMLVGGLRVDPAARHVSKGGDDLALTMREFDLLVFLLRNPGRVVGREELMREVWGWQFGDLSTVTVHIRRLRGKVEDDPARPRLIRTVWGMGYRLDAGCDEGAGGGEGGEGAGLTGYAGDVSDVSGSGVLGRRPMPPGPPDGPVPPARTDRLDRPGCSATAEG